MAMERWGMTKAELARQSFIDRLKNILKHTHYDAVIIDPLSEALPVEDENDNSEANMQMRALKDVARSTGVAIVAVHNSGLKTNKRNKKFLGKGATARSDRADIGLNFTAKGDTRRIIQVVKTRGANLNEEIQFEFADGLTYKLISSNSPDPTLEASYQVKLIELAREEVGRGVKLIPRKLFMSRLEIQDRTSASQAMDRAFTRNVAIGSMTHPKKGFYGLPDTVEAPSPQISKEIGRVA